MAFKRYRFAGFNSFDNLAFQPRTGNLYVIEDHDKGDVYACLPDGEDRDIKTDGCIHVLSVKDSSAEPTGFMSAPTAARLMSPFNTATTPTCRWWMTTPPTIC